MARSLKTIPQFANSTDFSESQIRWWIFNAKNNGLAATQTIKRIGRRIYIDADGFDAWIDGQNPAPERHA